MIDAIWRESRPKQWLKNVLVFAAPGAAGVLDDLDALLPTLGVFVALSLVASGTYFWNDIVDVEADRRHPTKRRRPIAAGEIPLSVARVVGSALVVLGAAVAFACGWRAGVAVSVYLVVTVSYSFGLKRIAVVDLMVVASGFVIRAIAGAEAADVPMSTWFLLCTSFGSLFIVTGKRFAEFREMGTDATTTRSTLAQYTMEYLRAILTVSLGATLVAYCIWAFETKEIADLTWPLYELSIVPMLGALLRYALLLERGEGSAPEEIFFRDRTIQVMGVLWVAVFAAGVYAS
ncbi:MAG: decaprenyl-phosphate phosphoribosyltransferase [Ilumatobacteraceae bacterium]